MAVKIMIRQKLPGKIDQKLNQLLDIMHKIASMQDGYFYNEYLTCSGNTSDCLVISTWQSLDHWRRWTQSRECILIQNKIEDLTENRTEYTVYAH